MRNTNVYLFCDFTNLRSEKTRKGRFSLISKSENTDKKTVFSISESEITDKKTVFSLQFVKVKAIYINIYVFSLVSLAHVRKKIIVVAFMLTQRLLQFLPQTNKPSFKTAKCKKIGYVKN
jgi:hypothetical protein